MTIETAMKTELIASANCGDDEYKIYQCEGHYIMATYYSGQYSHNRAFASYQAAVLAMAAALAGLVAGCEDEATSRKNYSEAFNAAYFLG